MWFLHLYFPKFGKYIFRGTDISKYFKESLGCRENENRLFISAILRVSVKPRFSLQLFYVISFPRTTFLDFNCSNGSFHLRNILIQIILLAYRKRRFQILYQYRFSSKTIIRLRPLPDVTRLGLLTTRLFHSGEQRPVDVFEAVCPLDPGL